MADRTMFAWRKIALVLASPRATGKLEAMGIPPPSSPTQEWARGLLDGVEDFWEVYDVEPDGGQAARELERDLAVLAGPEAMAGLVEAAALLSRPFDDLENLSQWQLLLYLLWRDYPPRIPVPDGLADRVRGVLATAGWPPPIIWDLTEDMDDDWERRFRSAHDIEPDVIPDEVVGHRYTEQALGRLAAVLTAEEQAALERWANAESDAHQPGPRPAIWPIRAPLALP